MLKRKTFYEQLVLFVTVKIQAQFIFMKVEIRKILHVPLLFMSMNLNCDDASKFGRVVLLTELRCRTNLNFLIEFDSCLL